MDTDQKKRVVLKKTLLGLGVFLALVLACSGLLWWSVTPGIGLGVSADEAQSPVKLPDGARNINYLIGKLGPADYVEFDLAEQAFIDWAKQNNWPVTEVTTAKAIRPQAFVDGQSSELKEIGNALFYQEQDPTIPDAGMWVIYDRQEQGVYYSEHDR